MTLVQKTLGVATRLRIPALLLVALAAGWFLAKGLSPAGPAGPSDGAHAEHAPGTDAAQTWTCAMHPQIQLPEPGPCPLCGMDLIPLEQDVGDAHSLRRLTVRPAARALMDIQTSLVERRVVEAEVRVVGKIEYDETRLAYITAWVPGRIDRLYVDFTGVEVQQGEHMAYVYSPKLYADQTALLESLARVRRLQQGGFDTQAETAYATLDAARERLRQLGLTVNQIEEIEERGTPSDHLTIYAPMGGVVVHRTGQKGMYVEEGTRIYTIADLSHLWVQLDAYESDMVWLRYGQKVEFTTEAYPGEVFRGTIAFLAPELDPRTRTFKVRVNLDNLDGKLKPEMFVRAVVRTKIAAGGRVMDPDLAGKWICPMHPEVVREEPAVCDVCGMDLVTTESRGYIVLPEDQREIPLVIPTSAALITGKRAVVYVEVPDAEQPTFEGREVVLGPRAGDWYLVASGLAEGERVVTHGNFKIDSALQIRARPSMMTPEGGGGTGVEAPLEVGLAARRELAKVEAAWNEVLEARATDDLEAVRAGFANVGEAVAGIGHEAFQGRSRAVWKELGMLLTNDAVEGRSAVDREEADRLIELTEQHLTRLRATFGIEDVEAPPSFVETPVAFREELTPLWQAYLASHQALVVDDPDGALEATAAARRSLGAIDPAVLETERARRAWGELAAGIGAALSDLEARSELDELREGFERLSAAMTRLVRTFGPVDGPVYEVECPMALGRGALWIQDTEEIRNPYLGSSMPRCGERVDVISTQEGADE